MTMAAVGYFMRKGGNALHLILHQEDTLDRHTQIVKDIWNTWSSLISDSMVLHLIAQFLHETSLRAIGKFLKQLKALMYVMFHLPGYGILFIQFLNVSEVPNGSAASGKKVSIFQLAVKMVDEQSNNLPFFVIKGG